MSNSYYSTIIYITNKANSSFGESIPDHPEGDRNHVTDGESSSAESRHVLSRRTFTAASFVAALSALTGCGGSGSSASAVTPPAAPAGGAPPSAPSTPASTPTNTWEQSAADRITRIEERYVSTIFADPAMVAYMQANVPALNDALKSLEDYYNQLKLKLEALAKSLDTLPKRKFDLTYVTEANALEDLARQRYALSKRRAALWELKVKWDATTGPTKQHLGDSYHSAAEKAEQEAEGLLVRHGLKPAGIEAVARKYIDDEKAKNLLPEWDSAVVALANAHRGRYGELLRENPKLKDTIQDMEMAVKAFEQKIVDEAKALDDAKARKETWSLWRKRQSIIPMWRSLSRLYALRGEALVAYIHYKQNPADSEKKKIWEDAQKSLQYKIDDVRNDLK